MHELEKKIVFFLNKPRIGYIDDFSAVISSIPFLLLAWFTVAAGILLYDIIVGIFVFMGLAIVFLLNLIVGEIIFKKGSKIFSLQRLRPYKAYPQKIHPIGENFSDSSFPSNHIASMTGGMLILVYFYPVILFPAVCMVLLISWSRLHNGMHYPTDILAGIFLGLGYGFVALEAMVRLF